jgi:hypothetical protein
VDDATVDAVADFIRVNREPLAAYVRRQLIAAGAKAFVDGLGKKGIEELRNEAGGVLLDLACALLRRTTSERELLSEDVLHVLPEDLRKMICLPRSNAYYNALENLKKSSSNETG